MCLMERWSTTVRNKRVPISAFMGTLATDDPDKELTTIWEFMVLREYRLGFVTRILGGLLVNFDRQMLFPLFFW